jgi:alkylresorcinol/alkylpyrone synthase
MGGANGWPPSAEVSVRIAAVPRPAYPESMEPVRIVAAATAHPAHRISQAEAARRVGELAADGRRLGTLARRKVASFARASQIESRALVLPADEVQRLGSIEQRNAVYRREAPGLAFRAATAALGEAPRDAIGALVTSSCTGYSVPGWGVELVEELGLPCDTARLPITESGCAGGVVALARAVDYLRVRPGAAALAVAAELCSLSFHSGGDEGNLTASLIFGDGAGAALLEGGAGAGLEVIDSASALIPGTRDALGFDLTDRGFYPVLTRELVTMLPPAMKAAAARLFCKHGLETRDIGAWLLHPGGARILSGMESMLGLASEQTQWSWGAMREAGNTSSAAIFDVLARYLAGPRPPEHAVVAAFGPGVSIELLLVRREC